METELFEQSFTLNKSKLDKAQARRLKMPKRNRSAYFLFSMDVRAKLKAELGSNLTPLETQAKVSQYWKDLSPEDKEKFEIKAREEKVEYLAAMEKFYSSLTPETLEKSKSNRPKKPCSAYAHFVRDVKTDLKKENPRLIMQEILHIVSDKWKNLEESKRAFYEEKARKDKEQYMIAIKKFTSEEQGSPCGGEQLGKRAMRLAEDSDKAPHKQVKLESRSESQGEVEEPTYKLVKIESQELTNVTTSPSHASENGQEMLGKVNTLPIQLLQLNAMKPINFPEGFEVQMPGLRENVMARANAMYMGDYGKMQEMMMAKITYANMVQANKSLEQAIVRRIAEVRALQAQQQFMFAQRLLMATNAGSY